MPVRPSAVATLCADVVRAADALLEMLEGPAGAHSAADDRAVASLVAHLEPLLVHGRRTAARLAADGPDPAPARPARTRTIEELAGPSVQATAAEILECRRIGAPDRMRTWLRDTVHDDTTFGDDGGADPHRADSEEGADPVAALLGELHAQRERRGRVPTERLLEVLLEDVGRWATLQGTAATMPIASLLTLIGTSKKSGCLHFRRNDEHLRFVFADGTIVATATDNSPPDQLLGHLLVARGALTAARREDLVALARSRGVPLGAAALDTGYVRLEALVETLTQQVHARFDRVFGDPHVAYAFVPTTMTEGDGHIRVNARELLFDSARRCDEAQRPGPRPER